MVLVPSIFACLYNFLRIPPDVHPHLLAPVHPPSAHVDELGLDVVLQLALQLLLVPALQQPLTKLQSLILRSMIRI